MSFTKPNKIGEIALKNYAVSLGFKPRMSEFLEDYMKHYDIVIPRHECGCDFLPIPERHSRTSACVTIDVKDHAMSYKGSEMFDTVELETHIGKEFSYMYADDTLDYVCFIRRKAGALVFSELEWLRNWTLSKIANKNGEYAIKDSKDDENFECRLYEPFTTYKQESGEYNGVIVMIDLNELIRDSAGTDKVFIVNNFDREFYGTMTID